MALSALAEIYRAQGKPDAAIEGYRTVLKLEPRQPQMWYQLATLYLDLGREAEARRTFEEALKHNPKMGSAYNSLAALAFERGDMAEAERLVRRGLELEEDLRSSRFNLGRILEARGDAADAEKLYREELSQFADNGRARFNLAQLARQRGDEAGFLAELRASTEKAPEFGPAFFFLAREELRAGRLDAAAELARQGLDGGQGLAGGAARSLRPRRRLQPPGQAARRRRTRWRRPGGSSPPGATPRRRGTEGARVTRRRQALLGTLLVLLLAAGWLLLRPAEPLAPGLPGAIVFVSDRDGTPALYWRRLPRDRERRLTFGSEAVGEPAVSPDGTRVAFSMNGRIGVVAVAERRHAHPHPRRRLEGRAAVLAARRPAPRGLREAPRGRAGRDCTCSWARIARPRGRRAGEPAPAHAAARGRRHEPDREPGRGASWPSSARST